MSKEVLLMADVPALGAEGDVVKVSDGYARNYLLPRNLAAPVTEATRRRIEKNRRVRAEQDAAKMSGAQELVAKIEKISCTVTVKTGGEGKMFGSVTAQHIADAMKVQGVELDRHQIELADAIRELGVFTVQVRVHPQLTAALKVWVVEE